MGNAKITKQVLVTTKDEVGQFFEVTSAIADAKVNLTGICAWGKDNQAFFALLTNDNAKAIAALTAKGFQASEQDVVTVMLEDKVGAAKTIAKKIRDAGLNLDCVYGTVCGCKDTSAFLVISSKENAKVVSCLNG